MEDESEQLSNAEDPLGRLPVFVYNMSEDVWPFISAIKSKQSRINEIAENSAITDREFVGFCAEHPSGGIFISPSPIDPDFKSYAESLLKAKNIEVLVPSIDSGRTAKDVREDPKIMERLKRVQSFDLYSYCPSRHVFDLIDALKGNGCEVRACQLPDRESWKVVGHWATKGGIRQLASTWMPDGQVYDKVTEAIEAGIVKAMKGGVVLKTNKGHSGMGVAIFPPDTSLSAREWHEKIKTELFTDNGFWDKFPVVVEDYVAIDKKIAGGVPNVECLVDENGEVKIMFYCGVRILRGGVFAGVEIADNIAPKRYMQDLEKVGRFLGKAYADAGYRGYFDVDCLIGDDGRFYLGESNIRRTGGTYAYHIARRLLGADFTKRYYIATRMTQLNQAGLSFGEIGHKLNSLIWDEQRGEGIILISSNLMKLNKFVYIVISRNRSGALTLEKAMYDRLLT